uniref:Uncharacterized protein n=1 Tax=Lygus hesperus TaxID=30085 RepID=A0A0K8STS2_LYGHE
MSQTKTSKERKTKAPTAVNNGVAFHKNATVQKVVKEAKQDVKTEHGKPSDKNQPTAEQMRIAQIIDTKSEDPSLKEKLMQESEFSPSNGFMATVRAGALAGN